MSIRRSKSVLVCAGAIAAVMAMGISAPATAEKGPGGLELGAMAGVPMAFTSPPVPMRNLSPGGLPWVIGPAKAEVTASGKVEVKFRDLLFAPGTAPAGTNTIPVMKVIVSCVTDGGDVVNVSTPTFPVTIGVGAGDGSVEAMVSLPETCLAPLVFVTTVGDRWLAVGAL
jgi:hypothetical protein